MGFADFPTSAWSAVFYLSQNGTVTATVPATEVSGEYKFTVSAATTASLTPGLHDYAIYVTETATSQRATAETGQVTALPNLAATQVATHAQQMVTALEAALLAFAGTDKLKVEFNGQSFERANMAAYRSDLVFWQSRVIREREQFSAFRGQTSPQSISPRFT